MFRKYWERNLSVIPVKGKRPFLNNWSKYCKILPTEAEIDEWERLYKFPEYGVGLCCGPASGVIFIDWDTESPDLKSLVPPSLVVRVGSKGGGSAFLYTDDIPSIKVERDNLGPNKHLKEKEGFEFLTTGRMIVLPPSRHPDTMREYFWLTRDTLENFDVCDLPKLSIAEVNEMISYVKCFKNTTKAGNDLNLTVENNLAGSRNGRLTQIVCAIISQHPYKSDEEIAKEIYEHDEQEFGEKAYFKSKDRQHNQRARGNASLAALLFAQEHRKRLIKKGLAVAYEEVKSISVESIVNPPPVKERVMPELSGLIREVQQTVLRISRSKQEDLALGASLAMMAAMTSNKFHIVGQPAVTHLYIMNVAHSGQGKGAGFYIANKLFGPGILERHNLLGLRNYSSVPAFISHLGAQRSRLDMIDEFGAVIESFTKGSQLAKDTESLLNELYTNRGDHWKGHFTATSGWKGGCYAPAVTVYANIQEETLVNKATKSMIDSGLLGRFLYFSGRDGAEYNFKFNEPIDVTDLAKEIDRIFPFYKIETVLPDGSIVMDPGMVDPVREPLVYAHGFQDYRTALDFEMYTKGEELRAQGDLSACTLLSRSVQMAERIAIINAVCCGRREITREDLDFGLNVFKYSSRRSEDYLNNVSAGSNSEKHALRLKKILKPVQSMSHSRLLRKSKLTADEFGKVIKTLKESEVIEELKDQTSGARHYRYKH
jgi:hypothetical protein